MPCPGATLILGCVVAYQAYVLSPVSAFLLPGASHHGRGVAVVPVRGQFACGSVGHVRTKMTAGMGLEEQTSSDTYEVCPIYSPCVCL